MTQTEALSILKMGHNVYLTGAAGSGKTWLLNEYIAFLRERGVAVAVTASTGIAATHMGGLTIHAWSGIGIAQTLSDGELRHLAKKPQLRRRIERTRVLIIDEVSMLDARRFDLIERVVRFMKGNWEPFGGLQVVLSGDFFQLPPIARSGEPPVELVCASDAWRSLRIAVLYLSEQHRQTDAAYSAVLHDIRTAAVDERTLTALAARHHGALADGQRPTRLYTHNVDVDAVNEKELATIAGDPVSYHMATDGVGALARELRRGCLAPEELRVKKGALVMFVKNNVEAGYVNGTLGTVSAIDASGYPLVKTRSGREIVAEPERWIIESEGKVLAELRQVPLRLAWAITVHKSQGMTLDAAEMDLSRAFVPGMGYVALSRVKTLQSMRLLGMNDMALCVSAEALRLDAALQAASRDAADELCGLDADTRRSRVELFLKAAGATPRGSAGGLASSGGGATPEQLRSVAKAEEAYKPWTPDGDRTLAAAFTAGNTTEALAELFGRTRGAIRSRLKKLGLVQG